MVKRNINGILLLDKPYGISSNKALQIVKYLFSARKCGHTGTLDPMATGVLPICIGEATKFSAYLLNARKSYQAVLKLGFMSTTGDVEGEIEQVSQVQENTFSMQECDTVLDQFRGEIKQLPPMYSALKFKGKPLYAYARKGEAVERNPRTVNIYDIKAESLLANELTLSVECGTGTYIRTLAEDIGKALGCGGAYLVNLSRTSVANFNLAQSITLEALEAMNIENRDAHMLPVDSLLRNIPSIILDKEDSQYLLQGRVLLTRHIAENLEYSGVLNDKTSFAREFRLYYQNHFLGLGEISGNTYDLHDSYLKPKRLVSNSYLDAQGIGWLAGNQPRNKECILPETIK